MGSATTVAVLFLLGCTLGARYNVVDYGAVGDGHTLCTHAFQAAIAALATSGAPGIVFVPAGSFLTGPFNFTSHMTLYLDTGAAVIGSDDHSLYPLVAPLPSYGQGRDHPGPRHMSLIGGAHIESIAIVGAPGTKPIINGQGQSWWAAHRNGTEQYTRGHLIEFMFSTNITITNVNLTNSPFWTVHPYVCSDVIVRNIVVYNPLNSPNTDGVDPDSSTNILIEDSYFHTGDDGVAIKSGWDCFGIEFGVPSQDIVVRNLTVWSPTASGVCIGSEMSGGVRNVHVSNCNFTHTATGILVKAGLGRGGYVRDVSYDDILIDGVGEWAIQINDFYGSRNPSCGTRNSTALPIIDNIHVSNVRGTNNHGAVNLQGLAASPPTRIRLTNVRLPDCAIGFNCSNVSGTADNVVPPPCSQLAHNRA